MSHSNVRTERACTGPRRTPAVLASALAWAACNAAPDARAQGFLPDRIREEGEGFRTDSAEIHTSFATDLGYDSNVFLEDTDPDGSALLRLTGNLFIQPRRREGDGDTSGTGDTGTGRKLDFRFGLSASYYHFFLDSARDNVGGDLDVRLRTRPEGKVSFELGEHLVRTVRPFTDATPAGFGTLSYGQNQSTSSLGLAFQSRGGVLRANVGYTADITFFDDARFAPNNGVEHRIATRFTWSFFPRTVFFYEGGAQFRGYGLGSSATPFSALVDSRRTSAIVGLNGILHPKLAATASVGYAAGFFDTGSEYSTYLARLELRYRPKPAITLTAGFSHEVQPAYIGNFEDVTMGYVNTEMAFVGRFLVGSQLAIGLHETGEALRPDGAYVGNFTTRADTRALARVYGEYRPTSYLAVTLALEYLGSFTDYAFNVPVGSAVLPDPSSAYQRVDAWLGLRVFH